MAAITPQASVPIVPGFGIHIPGTGTGSDQPGFNIGGNNITGHPTQLITSTEQGLEKVGQIAVDLTNPDFWLRIGEFTVGGILLTVGLSKMFNAGQHARGAARSAERSARVAYSVTPTGSAVNRGARSVARTARRSRA